MALLPRLSPISTCPFKAPTPHLLKRALLFQRHQLVAAMLLSGTGLAQAHPLHAAVVLQRAQVARAQALLQAAKRRHQAVAAQRGAAFVRGQMRRAEGGEAGEAGERCGLGGALGARVAAHRLFGRPGLGRTGSRWLRSRRECAGRGGLGRRAPGGA